MKRFLSCGFAAAALVAATLPCPAAVRLVSPADGEVVPLLSEGQKARLDAPRAERVAKFADEAERKAMKKLGYVPLPAQLRWEWTATEGGGPAAGARPLFTVEVRRMPEGVPVFRADCSEPFVEVVNLEIAREYEWTVWASALGRVEPPVTGTFRTEDHAPRLMACGAVPNVRDLGGRVGLGGRRVRQGLVYRSAGLNDNAGPEYYTREETLARVPDPAALLALEKPLVDDIETMRRFQMNPASFTLLRADLGREWTLFRVDYKTFMESGEAALRALDGVPAEFLGAAAQAAIPDESGKCQLDDPDGNAEKQVAVFFQSVDCDKDGWISLGCGADWWWKLFVNGETAFDRSSRDHGNGNPAKSADDHVFPVRVRKGRNLLAAVVRTGSEGWSWACRSAPAVPVATLLAGKISNDQFQLDSLFRQEKGLKAGASRIGDGNRDVFLRQMGIRSDIDLRSDRECFGMEGSPLGPDVTWWHYSSGAYSGMVKPAARAAFANVFRVFLDPANYPIDFHCIAGQDRTGAVAFILNALLGVEEEELWRDWEATGFWNGSVAFNHQRLFNHLVAAFDSQPGKTLHDRVLSYVLSLGFTMRDIETFREIMLEPLPENR